MPYVAGVHRQSWRRVRFPVGGGGLELVTRLDGRFVGETWFHPVQDEAVPNLFTGFGFGQGEFSKQNRDA